MNLDFSADYLTWDNIVAVRYETARAASSVADLPPLFDGRTPAPSPPRNRNRLAYLEVAKRRPLSQRELAASGGVYTSQDIKWLLPAAVLPNGLIPKLADVVIEEDGTRWTVQEVENRKNRQTWGLTCRDLVLAYDLRDSVTIERPAIGQDAAGVNIKSFPSDAANPGGVVLYASLPARAQLISKDIAEQRGIRGLEGKYSVIVGQEVDVTSEDRVLLGNGLYLDIVGYEQAMRIDELPRIICERRI